MLFGVLELGVAYGAFQCRTRKQSLPSPFLKALGMAIRQTELSKEISIWIASWKVFLAMTYNIAHTLLNTLRYIMCTFGLQIKKENKISGLSDEWPCRGYLILLSLFLLSLSKSLYFCIVLRLKWSNASMSGHDRYLIHQMGLHLNPLSLLLT